MARVLQPADGVGERRGAVGVRVRRGEPLDVSRRPAAAPLLGRERGRRRRDAVVGELGHQGAGATGGGRGQPPGQVGRLAAGVDQQHGVEPGRHRRHQALGELDGARVQVAQVGAEQPRLVGDRPAHTRVCVADDRDVVVGVDVRPAVGCRSASRRCRGRGAAGRSRSAGPARRRTRRRGGGAGRWCPAARRPAEPLGDLRRGRAPRTGAAGSARSSSQPWMYAAFSGWSAARQCEMHSVIAARSAIVSPRAASSSGSSGVTER